MDSSLSQSFSRLLSMLSTRVFTRKNGQRLQSLLLFVFTLIVQLVKGCLVIVFYIGKFLVVFALLFVTAVGLSQRSR